jgi:prepilin-type N-terminal cleavage/methylation domain-containing protein
MRTLRAFTLVELAAVLAIAGIITALGVVAGQSMVDAERSRNAAIRFANDVRRHRAEAIQRKMYSHVEITPSVDGVDVVLTATRTGSTPTTSPCTDMASGTVKPGDIVLSEHYDDVVAAVTQTEAGAPTAVSGFCLSPQGRPVNETGTAMVAVSLALNSGDGVEQLALEIDTTGSVTSTDLASNTGIATTAYHPNDTLAASSAPLNPNVDDDVQLPAFEVSPGVYSNAAGGSSEHHGGCGDQGDDDSGDPLLDLCGCGSATCIYECTYTNCPAPCDVCFNDCCLNHGSPECATYAAAHPEYASTYGCFYDPHVGCP